MLEGVKIIAERIRAFPEEVHKWKHFMNTQLTDMLTPEEHECINEALKEHFRQDFNARVLDSLNDNSVTMHGFGVAEVKAEGGGIGRNNNNQAGNGGSGIVIIR